MPTILGIDTFAHGVFSTAGGGLYKTVNGTPSKDTTILRGNDPASALYNPAAGGTAYTEFPSMTGTPAIGWIGFAYRCEQRPSADSCFLRLWTAGGTYALQITATTSDIYAFQSGGSAFNHYTNSLSTWYWIEMIYDVTGTTHTFAWRVNGVDQTGESATGLVATTIDKLSVGVLTSAATTSAINRFSCVAWGSASSTSDWLGEQTARAVSPARVGTHNLDAATSTFFFKNAGSNVAITSSETDSYTYIDDVPLSGGTDYDTITGATPTNTWYLEHYFASLLVSKDPSAVRAIDTIRNVSGTTANVIGSKVSDDGTNLTNIYNALSVGSASNIYKTVTMASKPSGGSWTLTALNALRHRWGYSSDASPAIEIQSTMLEAIFPLNAWTAGGIGSVAGTSATGTTQAVTLSAAVAAGDLIFVCVNHDTNGGTAPSTSDTVTDSLGNTYRRIAAHDNVAHFQGMSTHYTIVTNPGTPTITATFAATCVWRSMAAGAWSNSAGAITLDQNGDMNDTTASSGTCTAPSITPRADNALVFGAWCGVSAAGAWSPGTGYATDVNVGSTAADLIEFVVQTTAAAISPTATNNSSAIYIGQAVSFVAGVSHSQVVRRPAAHVLR